MLRQGPIPAVLHGLYEYLGGALLIAAPLLINYHSDAATAISVAVGVLLIVLAATSAGQAGLVAQLPVAAHLIVDCLVAALLIASPFLFTFTKHAVPTAIFIGGGVLHLLVTIGTRFRGEPVAPRRRRLRPRPAPASATPVPERGAIPTEGGERGGAASVEGGVQPPGTPDV